MFALDTVAGVARQAAYTVIADGEPARRSSLGGDDRPSLKTTPHPETAMTDASQRPICIFFAMGGCIRGSRCPFSHELRQEAPAGVDVSAGYFITGKVANYRSGTVMSARQAGGPSEVTPALPPSTLASADEMGQSSCGSVGPSLASSPTITTSAPPMTRLATRGESGNLSSCLHLSQQALGDAAETHSPQTQLLGLTTGAAAPTVMNGMTAMPMTDFRVSGAQPCVDGAAVSAPLCRPASVMSTVSGVRLTSMSDVLRCRSDGSQLSLQEHGGRGSFLGSLPVSDDTYGAMSMETNPGQSITSDQMHITLTRTPPQVISRPASSSMLTPPGAAGELTGVTMRVAAPETTGKYEPRYTLRQSAFHPDDAVVVHRAEQTGRAMTSTTRTVVTNTVDDARTVARGGVGATMSAEQPQQGRRVAWPVGGGGVHVPAAGQRPASAPDLASTEESTPLSVVVHPAIARLAVPQSHLDGRYTASSQHFTTNTTQLGSLPSDTGMHPAQRQTHITAGVQSYGAHGVGVHPSSTLQGKLGAAPQQQQHMQSKSQLIGSQHQAISPTTEVYVGTRPMAGMAQQQQQHGSVTASAAHAPATPLTALQRGGGTSHIQVPAPRTRMVQQRLQQQSKQESATHFVAPQPRSKMMSGNNNTNRKSSSAATQTMTSRQGAMHSTALSPASGATQVTPCAGYYAPGTSPRQGERVVYLNSPEPTGLRPSVTMSESKPVGVWGGPRRDIAAMSTSTTLLSREDDVPRFASTMTVGHPNLLSAATQQRLGAGTSQPTVQPQGPVALSQTMLPTSQLLFRQTASGEQEAALAKSVRTLSLQPQYSVRDGEAASTTAVLHPLSPQEGGAALRSYTTGSAGGGLVPVVFLTNGNSFSLTSGLSGADGVTYTPVKTYMGGNFVLVGHTGSPGGSAGTLVGTVAQQ